MYSRGACVSTIVPRRRFAHSGKKNATSAESLPSLHEHHGAADQAHYQSHSGNATSKQREGKKGNKTTKKAHLRDATPLGVDLLGQGAVRVVPVAQRTRLPVSPSEYGINYQKHETNKQTKNRGKPAGGSRVRAACFAAVGDGRKRNEANPGPRARDSRFAHVCSRGNDIC